MWNKFLNLVTILTLLSLLIAPVGRVNAQESSPFSKKMAFRSTGDKPAPSKESTTPVISGILPITRNLFRDPSFEASLESTAHWQQFSSNFGTPLCSIAKCTNGGGTAGPRTGNVWAWFGGTVNPEIGSVQQNVTFPSCGATLQFYFWIGAANPGSDENDVFIVFIDGNVVFSANATQAGSYASYTLVSRDVSSFADGAPHQVEFYSETSDQTVNFNLDDVALRQTIPPSSGCAAIAIKTNATSQGTYGVPKNTGARLSFPVESGPVRITSTNSVPFIASERLISPKGSSNLTHFSEMMGLPVHLRSTKYFFPAYDSLFFNSQLRFANVGNANTTVIVTIGGVERGRYNLAPNQSAKPSYPNLSSGPVVVQSTGGVPIVVSLRVVPLTFNGSYSEIMGLPQSLAGNSHVFPWYNNLDLNSQLRIANVGTVTTTVTVKIAGVTRGTFTLAPNTHQRVSFAVNAGPVRVTSSNNVPIVTAMRVAFKSGNNWVGFSEWMGLPQSQIGFTYYFPWYNNVNLTTQLRVANLGASPASVRVFIGGQEAAGSPFSVAAGASIRKSFAANNGPVRIASNQPIVTSLRVLFANGSTVTSYSELMGLPRSQLSTGYYFPWYNNVGLDTQLRLGIP